MHYASICRAPMLPEFVAVVHDLRRKTDGDPAARDMLRLGGGTRSSAASGPVADVATSR